jgi:predicted AAA+ superfamily ATPase
VALTIPFCEQMKFINRFFKEPSYSFFLFGPRGTGKSTLIHSLYKEAIWVDLLKPDILRSYLAYPERLEELIEGQPHISTIVIDEIQKAPGLLTVIHSLIESKKNKRFILTGSSARKIKRMDADLLGGRAIKRMMHPFIAAELGDEFDLEKALSYGLVPLIFMSDNPEDTSRAYMSLYVHEEVQSEGLIRNVGDFSRFLEVISFSHGAILNTSNIAREAQVNRKTVENYIAILEDLLLCFKVPVFTKKALRDLKVQPKFYLFDTGVYRGLRPKGILDMPQEIAGVALEGLVAQHLRAWVDYSAGKNNLYFWQTRSGVEVDFVVYGESGFWAIEVKNTKNIRPQDLKNLSIFLKDYPASTAILLYRGEEILKRNNILCLPVETFLKNITPTCFGDTSIILN